MMGLVFWCMLSGAVASLFSGHTRLGMVLALGVGMILGTTVAGAQVVGFLQLGR
jgi:hypothetical protein